MMSLKIVEAMPSKNIVVIGGGAAGFFSAINLAIHKPNYNITILEKTSKILAKVKISGGGRCNVTHHCFENSDLVKNYPRGNKELHQVFSGFNVQQTINWFKNEGIILKTEDDGRIFPISNSSQTIIDCFLSLSEKFKITIRKNCEVLSIEKKENQFTIQTNQLTFTADNVICAMGGHPKIKAYEVLQKMGHQIDEPVASLFSLNFPNEVIKKELQGISVKNVKVKVFNHVYTGPLIITHWGVSGPAVLKLSAFAAKEFYKVNYHADVLINWADPLKPHEIELQLKNTQQEKNKSYPHSVSQFNIPKRLWEFLCLKSDINNSKPWAEISKKNLLKLVDNISNSVYKMEGKTTFKEEFVTCGGVNLKEIDFKTMQSKLVPGLFFCGEILNIDGITGGFNFQSAWSTAFICSKNI